MMILSQTTQIQLITVVPILSILYRHYYDLFTWFYLDLCHRVFACFPGKFLDQEMITQNPLTLQKFIALNVQFFIVIQDKPTCIT